MNEHSTKGRMVLGMPQIYVSELVQVNYQEVVSTMLHPLLHSIIYIQKVSLQSIQLLQIIINILGSLHR